MSLQHEGWTRMISKIIKKSVHRVVPSNTRETRMLRCRRHAPATSRLRRARRYADTDSARLHSQKFAGVQDAEGVDRVLDGFVQGERFG